ncbi:universal stress protein [Williamsia maris]|uniref:Universal stress protein family protein n=1 Tax=Williamsia maris TaxID=72806 RepID=A0ABT1HEX9_9NOCA|nr:universal stress protein [Williamsia maris]MCP2176800.1 Universal stress protein family protein [Williamsia maris]
MRLIVGVADGATGDDALALAERCARSAGFHLDLCTVVTPVPTFGHDSAVEATYTARDEAAMTTLRALRDRLGDDIVAEIHLCHDDSPARGLATMAQHLEASAVVIGGEPASGGAASALLHASPFPIILAARASAHRGVARLGAITCALGPRSQDDLVRIAALCAQVADTPLRVMTLLVPPADVQDGTAPRAEHRDAMYQRLADATLLAQGCLPVDFPVTSVLVEGDSITDAAARLEWGPGDVVVLGSSRLAVPRRAFVGSSAAKMLRVLNVAAVVVPNDPYAYNSPEDARARTRRLSEERRTPTTPR